MNLDARVNQPGGNSGLWSAISSMAVAEVRQARITGMAPAGRDDGQRPTLLL